MSKHTHEQPSAITNRLLYACISGNLTPETLDELIAAGADLNCNKNRFGHSPLYLIIDNYDGELRIALLEKLLSSGANIRQLDSIFHSAVQDAPSDDVLRLFVKYGAQLPSESEMHNILSNISDAAMVKTLIDMGADINVRDYGKTPLFFNSNIDVVRVLIENGADVNAHDLDGYYLTDAHIENPEILKLLIQHGAPIRPESALARLVCDTELVDAIRESVAKQPDYISSLPTKQETNNSPYCGTKGFSFETDAEKISGVLNAAGIDGKIEHVKRGPVVNEFHFFVRDIYSLEPDAPSVGDVLDSNGYAYQIHDNHVIIYTNANERKQINTESLIWNPAFTNSPHRIPLALGVDTFGAPRYFDLYKMPHLFIAGKTGTGKTQLLHAIITSLTERFTNLDCRILMIDSHGVDLGQWDTLPHLTQPSIKLDTGASLDALGQICDKIDAAYKSTDKQTPPYTIIIIDELADMIAFDKDRTIQYITKIAQVGRGAGVHLVATTSMVDKIPREILWNMPVRIAFKARNADESKLILDETGAEKLTEYGDAWLYNAGATTTRIHTPMANEDYIAERVSWSCMRHPFDAAEYETAVKHVMDAQNPSIAFLQRTMNISYERAYALIDRMCDDNLVSVPDDNKVRHIIKK